MTPWAEGRASTHATTRSDDRARDRTAARARPPGRRPSPRSDGRRRQLQRRLLHPLLRPPDPPATPNRRSPPTRWSCPRGSPASWPASPSARRRRSKPRAASRASPRRANPSCPAASQVGRTLTGYGVGPALTYAPGRIYLAGPYKGAPLSLVTDQLGHGRSLRPRHDRDPLGLRGRPAHRAAADRLARLGPDPPHHRRHPAAPARRPHLHGPLPVHPQPVELRAIAADLDPDRLRGELRRPQPTTPSATVAKHFQLLNCLTWASNRSSASACAAAPRAATIPRCGRPSPRAAPQDSNLKRIAVDDAALAVPRPKPHQHRSAPAPSSQAEKLPGGLGLRQGRRPHAALRRAPARQRLPALLRQQAPRPGRRRCAAARCGSSLEGRIGPAKHGGIRAFFDELPDAPIDRFVMTLYGGKRGLLRQLGEHLRQPAAGDGQSAWVRTTSARSSPASCAASARARGRKGKARRAKGARDG